MVLRAAPGRRNSQPHDVAGGTSGARGPREKVLGAEGRGNSSRQVIRAPLSVSQTQMKEPLTHDGWQEHTCSHAAGDSEPSTLDSQSSTTLFLSSEEPGPSTTALPSSPSSSCEPQALSPGPSALTPLPAAAAPPGSSAPRRTGLYSVVASSPDAGPRLVDWLPGCPSATPPGVRGDEQERLAPTQGPERGRAPRPGAAGRDEDPGTSPLPCARPASSSLEANVGDILVELRTMNGHLDTIARALTKLASSLGPQPQPPPDAPDAN
nr:PREDICTED: putative protein TPRXL [Equus przewalskii]